ncbi:MAG TPA: hypothetical protein VJ254_07150, partial [Streptosporangiaceae bacterium]|nr:hypothetical protein [Streptosporangiaceae bacterium]
LPQIVCRRLPHAGILHWPIRQATSRLAHRRDRPSRRGVACIDLVDSPVMAGLGLFVVFVLLVGVSLLL